MSIFTWEGGTEHTRSSSVEAEKRRYQSVKFIDRYLYPPRTNPSAADGLLEYLDAETPSW